MTDLVVRRLLIDLKAEFPRRWVGGDAFRSAFLNALSMSFPVGEQFFIDSVREGLQHLPEAERARFEAEVKGFVGQEATHRHLHGLFNAQLEREGLVNTWGPRAQRHIKRLQGMDVRNKVGITAAYEHFTAILAEWLLRHPQVLGGSEPRLQTLWLWHAAEESEHRSTAFDLYLALGGGQRWRLRLFRVVSVLFVLDVARQTVRNLWADRALFRPSTWRSAWAFLWGREMGLLRTIYRPWKAYFSPGFHPGQQDVALAEQWLQTHQRAFMAIEPHA
jgi:uncharacterized protein